MRRSKRETGSEGLTMNLRLTASRYGTRTPEIEVRIPSGWSHRKLKAVLFGLGMDIEALTPASERWITEIETQGDSHGRVYLELIEADDREVEQGMRLLAAVLEHQTDLVTLAATDRPGVQRSARR